MEMFLWSYCRRKLGKNTEPPAFQADRQIKECGTLWRTEGLTDRMTDGMMKSFPHVSLLIVTSQKPCLFFFISETIPLTSSKCSNVVVKLIAYGLSAVVHNVRLSIPWATNHFFLSIALVKKIGHKHEICVQYITNLL